MMALKLLGLLRPTLSGKGPQLRREPGIEHVLVLMHVMTAAFGAHIGILEQGIFPTAVLAVENRNAMAPPQLAGDAPVFKVLHPGGVGLRPARGVERHLAGVDGIERRPLELIDSDEPLLGKPGLKRSVATIAMHNGVVEILNVIEQAVLLKPCDNGLTALIAVHARELAVALDDHRMLVKDIDLRQVVSLTHSIVVGVVRGSDLDEAGTEARVHVVIGEDGDLAVDDRQLDGLAHKGGLLGILGRDGHAGIAQHGLGTRGGNNNVILAVHRLGERVAQVPQMAVLVMVFGLVVRDSGGAVGAPVDDALTAIDQAVMIPIAKHATHGLGIIGIHGKALVVEVDRAAHALDLLDDDAAVLMGPIPAGVDKLVATDLQAADALALELLIDFGLRGDTRVIGTEHPARGLTAHARHTDDGILNRVVGSVTHVELTGDIGGRNGDGAVAHASATLVVAAIEPLLQDLGLVLRRVVNLWHFFSHISLPFSGRNPVFLSLGQVLLARRRHRRLRLVRNLRKANGISPGHQVLRSNKK